MPKAFFEEKKSIFGKGLAAADFDLHNNAYGRLPIGVDMVGEW